MRKLLLASAAALGATVGSMGFAAAQTTNLPPAVLQGVPQAPQANGGANNNNNYQAAMLPPGPVANPVPGSIVVRVNARVVFYGAAESSSLDVTKGVGPNNTGAAKLAPYTTLGYGRLYFGMDGMATNGMRYGAAIELRINAGPIAGSSANSQSSNSTFSDTPYERRAFLYIASDKAGIFRGGQADGPFGIFDNGITTFQGFDDGGWDGDLPGAIPGNAQPTWPFITQQGAEYASSKFVYLSPQLFGFDFGVSWAPNNASLQDGASNSNTTSLANITTLTACGTAATGCYALSSSSVNNDGARFTNMYELAARYQNTFGPVGLLAYAGYMGSGHVQYTGPGANTVDPITHTTSNNTFNGLAVGVGGAAISIGGFQFGGNAQYGEYNGIAALQPKGGVKAIAWLGGVQYSAGPFTVGSHYFAYDSQGSPSLVGVTQRHEQGLAVGMTYGIAPGLNMWVSYIYGQRHQGDYNFQTGVAGGGYGYNDVKGQAFGVGSIVKW